MKNTIHFHNPITPGEDSAAKLKWVAAFDDYFFLSGRKYSVIQSGKGANEYQVSPVEEKPNYLLNALKIVSYCTGIIPLLMLIGKAIARATCTFYTAEENLRKITPLPTKPLSEQVPVPSDPSASNISPRVSNAGSSEPPQELTQTSEEILPISARTNPLPPPPTPTEAQPEVSSNPPDSSLPSIEENTIPLPNTPLSTETQREATDAIPVASSNPIPLANQLKNAKKIEMLYFAFKIVQKLPEDKLKSITGAGNISENRKSLNLELEIEKGAAEKGVDKDTLPPSSTSNNETADSRNSQPLTPREDAAAPNPLEKPVEKAKNFDTPLLVNQELLKTEKKHFKLTSWSLSVLNRKQPADLLKQPEEPESILWLKEFTQRYTALVESNKKVLEEMQTILRPVSGSEEKSTVLKSQIKGLCGLIQGSNFQEYLDHLIVLGAQHEKCLKLLDSQETKKIVYEKNKSQFDPTSFLFQRVPRYPLLLTELNKQLLKAGAEEEAKQIQPVLNSLKSKTEEFNTLVTLNDHLDTIRKLQANLDTAFAKTDWFYSTNVGVERKEALKAAKRFLSTSSYKSSSSNSPLLQDKQTELNGLRQKLESTVRAKE